MEIVVEITKNIEKYEEITEEKIEQYVKDILMREYPPEDRDEYVSILLTGNEEIAGINREYRDKEGATDVISFAYNESENEGHYEVLGDIIISLERVEEQSSEYGHTFEREFYYVLTHGILHLLGYDHIEDEEKAEMREKEEEILALYGHRR
jgi:probable rRNA maturation factor